MIDHCPFGAAEPPADVERDFEGWGTDRYAGEEYWVLSLHGGNSSRRAARAIRGALVRFQWEQMCNRAARSGEAVTARLSGATDCRAGDSPFQARCLGRRVSPVSLRN